MEYDLELEHVVAEIRKQKARKICIQLPDGLKPRAKEIVDFVREKTGINPFIYLGSCFGACDIPSGLEQNKFDLLIQFGHSEFNMKGRK